MTLLALDAAHPAADAEWNAPLTWALPPRRWVAVRTSAGRAGALSRAVLGLALPAHGAITLLGLPLHGATRGALAERRRRVGSVLRPDGLAAARALQDNVALPLEASGIARDAARGRARALLDELGVARWADARPHAVPSDARELAALARAVVRDADLLVLDDPLASVRSTEWTRLLSWLRARVPAALVFTHRRNDPLYDAVDDVVTWDARGWRVVTGEVPA